MDIGPFISSGALSRSHYTLVRNVEGASTSQEVDRYLLAEVEKLRDRLSLPGLSSRQCKECLVLILYCSMSVTSNILANQVEFALHHAVNLAEAGSTIHERRIGYSFCAEMMPPNHELHLMLVNTLHKDLESSEAPRICLALDYIIQCPREDVIPAIQSRLHDLLSHNSPHVRRRVLFCVRALSTRDPSVLQWMSQEILKRLRDSDNMVAGAGIMTCIVLHENNLLGEEAVLGILKTLGRASQSVNFSASARQMTRRALRLVSLLSPSREAVQIVLELIQDMPIKPTRMQVLLCECFRVLRHAPLDLLSTFLRTPESSPIALIRQLVSSEEPNEQYVFLTCLECIDPVLWAGMLPERPAVLDAWEVERVMQFLDSADSAIRRKTLSILSNVDPNLLGACFSQTSETLSKTAQDDGMVTIRLLEIVEVVSGSDGELYARSVRDVFLKASGKPDSQSGRRVLEQAAERVLSRIRDGDASFGLSAATTLLTLAIDSGDEPGSASLMVIVAALTCEYAPHLSIAPVELLKALQKKLRLYPASIQEAFLLAMLRLIAECNEVPQSIVEDVTLLSEVSGRYIQRRCAQFLAFSKQPALLKRIASGAKSRSLPDFLLALESNQYPSAVPHRTPSSPPPRMQSPSSPRSSSTQALRYAAYDPPPPPPSRTRSHTRHKSSARTVSSSRSVASDDTRPGSALSAGVGASVIGETVSPGELALVAGRGELDQITSPNASIPTRTMPPTPVDLLGSRMDLISLDSPFLPEPVVSLSQAMLSSPAPIPNPVYEVQQAIYSPEQDFTRIWNALEKHNARGWCEAPLDVIVRRLQTIQLHLVVLSADQPPFEGELKIILWKDAPSTLGTAAMRLKDSDEDGCLWRLRCDDERFVAHLNSVLCESAR